MVTVEEHPTDPDIGQRHDQKDKEAPNTPFEHVLRHMVAFGDVLERFGKINFFIFFATKGPLPHPV